MKPILGNNINVNGNQPRTPENQPGSREEKAFLDRITRSFAALRHAPVQTEDAKNTVSHAIMLRYQLVDSLHKMDEASSARLARTIFSEFDQILSSIQQGEEHYQYIMSKMEPQDIPEVLAGKSPLSVIGDRHNNLVLQRNTVLPTKSQDSSGQPSVELAMEATEPVLEAMHKQETLRALQPQHVYSNLRRVDDPFALIERKFEEITGISAEPFLASEETMQEIEESCMAKIKETLGTETESSCQMILHDILREPHRQFGKYHSDEFLEDKGKALLLDNGIRENIFPLLSQFDMAANRTIWRRLGSVDSKVEQEELIDKLKKQQTINVFRNNIPSMQQLQSDDVRKLVKCIELEYDRDGEARFYYINNDHSRCEKAKGIYVITANDPSTIKFLSNNNIFFLERKFNSFVGHTSISGSEDVLAAGRLSLEMGELFLDDSSGHYMPIVDDLKAQLPHIYASKHIHYSQNFKNPNNQQNLPKLFSEIQLTAKTGETEFLTSDNASVSSMGTERAGSLLRKNHEKLSPINNTGSQHALDDSSSRTRQLDKQHMDIQEKLEKNQQTATTAVALESGVIVQQSLVQQRDYINSTINIVNIPSTSTLELSEIDRLSDSSQQKPNE